MRCLPASHRFSFDDCSRLSMLLHDSCSLLIAVTMSHLCCITYTGFALPSACTSWRCWLTSVYMDLCRPTWLMFYIRLLIYPADVVFAQHCHWPSPFLRQACGQLVIMFFRQLHHWHGTLFPRKSRHLQHCQHLSLNWRHMSFLFLFLIFGFLCTVTAVLYTIHFKFLIMIMINYFI